MGLNRAPYVPLIDTCSCTAARTDIAAPSRDLLLSAEPAQVKKDAAAMVLQRLLRGRAMQTKMYEGLQSKLALIRVRRLRNNCRAYKACTDSKKKSNNN